MDSVESERIVVAARLERIAVVLERMVCLLEDVRNIMLTGDDVAPAAQENAADSAKAARDVPSAGADERVGKWLRDAGYKRLGFPGVATW